MKSATFLIYVVCFLFITYGFKLREENLILETVNENNYNE